MNTQQLSGHRKLIAWQKGLDLVDAVYDAVERLPNSELYVLSAQMRRAALSIPSNIAEGYCRTPKANLNHLDISQGSSAELDTHVHVCLRRKFLPAADCEQLLERIVEERRILYGLSASIERRFGPRYA